MYEVKNEIKDMKRKTIFLQECKTTKKMNKNKTNSHKINNLNYLWQNKYTPFKNDNMQQHVVTKYFFFCNNFFYFF